MSIILEVKVYENGEEAPEGKRLEVTGLSQTLHTANVNQALQLIRKDIERVFNGPVEKD